MPLNRSHAYHPHLCSLRMQASNMMNCNQKFYRCSSHRSLVHRDLRSVVVVVSGQDPSSCRQNKNSIQISRTDIQGRWLSIGCKLIYGDPAAAQSQKKNYGNYMCCRIVANTTHWRLRCAALHARPSISSKIFAFSLLKYYEYIPNILAFVIWIKIW